MKLQIDSLRGHLTRLGGDHFLKPSHYLLAAVVVLVSGVSISSGLTSFERLALYFLANLLSILVTAIPFGLVKLLKKFLNRDFNLALVIGTGLSLGVTKSVSTALFVSDFGLEPIDFALQSRVFSGTLVGVIVVLAVSALPLVIEDFDGKRALLIREAVARKLADSITPIAKDLITELGSLSEGNKSKTEVSERLERLVADKLRPITKDLWESTSKRYPELKLQPLFAIAFRETPIPLLPILVVYALGTSGFKQLAAGDPNGLLIIAIQSVGIIATLALANSLKKTGHPVGSFLTAGFGLPLSAAASSGFFELVVADYSPVPGSVLMVLTAFVIVAFLTTLSAGFSARRVQNSELSRTAAFHLDLESEELSRLLASRRAAAILHGRVQNRILGSAVRIGGSSGDHRSEIDALILQLKALGEVEVEAPLNEALDQLVANWQGVLLVSWEIEGTPRLVSMNVVESIQEGVTNAHKHGLANSVTIKVRFDYKSIAVEIADDGIGPRGGMPGVGQRLLDTIGPWKLTSQRNGGSLLNFVARD
jgi:hypothetical protein